MKKKKMAPVTFAADTTASEKSDSLSWPSLTGLRGIAALWVFVLHAYTSADSPESVPSVFSWLFQMGWTGVDVFFTLSAFLLAVPFVQSLRDQKAMPASKPYFLRRFARILPAYYLQCVILAAIFYFGFSKVVFWYEPTALGWLAHSVFWINAVPLVPAYLSPWWTLPVELGFYLLLPLLAKCLTDKRWWWLLIGVVLSLGYRYVLLHSDLSRAEEIFWVDHLPGRLFQFLIGMLAAFFFIKWRLSSSLTFPLTRNVLLFSASIALIALPALDNTSGPLALAAPTVAGLIAYYHLFASLLIAVILLMLASGKTLADGLLASWPLQWLGRISYGLYLWHYPVILLLREQVYGMQAAKSDFLSFFIASFLISITLAFLSWYWWEQPILKRFSSGKP